MSKTVNLADLTALLVKIEEEREVRENAYSIAPSSIVPVRRSLRDLMDRYDIRDVIAGRRETSHGVYARRGTDVLVPPTTLEDPYSSVSRFPWPTWATYGGIGRQLNANVVLAGVAVPEETETERNLRLERKEAEKRRIESFDDLIDNVGAAPSAKLENPYPASARSPDYMHTITAWRGWDSDGCVLQSLGNKEEWRPRMSIPADCACSTHPAPDLHCRCGYWSFKRPELMKKALHNYIEDVAVVGSVEIWGRVIECENGWRSEFAYPKELWLLKPGLESLSWTYGVPVRRL